MGSKDYVTRQPAEQRITFQSADSLTPAEHDTPHIVKYAGQGLTTGKQAERYANHCVRATKAATAFGPRAAGSLGSPLPAGR